MIISITIDGETESALVEAAETAGTSVDVAASQLLKTTLTPTSSTYDPHGSQSDDVASRTSLLKLINEFERSALVSGQQTEPNLFGILDKFRRQGLSV